MARPTGRRDKRKRKRRHKKELGKAFQKVRARFPRLFRFPRLRDGEESMPELLEKLRQLRADYPPPFYNWWRDGDWNPAEACISWAINLPVEKLRERCEHHGLSSEGRQSDMLKRIYLHWRDQKLKEGYPYIGYGPGFERVTEPDCPCGKVKATRKRFPRLRKRFPRLVRFPRLGGGFGQGRPSKEWLENYRKLYEKGTGRVLKPGDLLFHAS